LFWKNRKRLIQKADFYFGQNLIKKVLSSLNLNLHQALEFKAHYSHQALQHNLLKRTFSIFKQYHQNLQKEFQFVQNKTLFKKLEQLFPKIHSELVTRKPTRILKAQLFREKNLRRKVLGGFWTSLP
jgi:hypothetical protein